jgi:hypothetical protein
MRLDALLGLAFAPASPYGLTLPHRVTRRPIMQKVRGHTFMAEAMHSAPTACRRTVSGTISLPSPGFFSPFPRGTSSLSVSQEYLALRDGPRGFSPDCTCPAILGYLLRSGFISSTGLSPSLAGHSMPFIYNSSPMLQAPRPLGTCVSRFRLFRFRSPLLTESMSLSFPPGT